MQKDRYIFKWVESSEIMYILGLNIGHNATACLLKDGKIISCVSEERFTRIKNHSGVPFNAIKYVLDNEKISPKELDYIVLDDHYGIEPDPKMVDRILNNFKRKGLKFKIAGKLFYNNPNLHHAYTSLKEILYRRKLRRKNADEVRECLRQKLKIDTKKIIFIDHHLAHALSTCFNLPNNKKTLIFTLDGEGSGYSASVNIFDGKNIRTIARSRKAASIGFLYGNFTICLGMRPLEHEFKVMGLAPYAKKDKVDEVYKMLNKILWVDGLEFKSAFEMVYSDQYFYDKLRFTRFDNVAGGVQKLTEELILKWVKNAIDKTKIKDVAMSGGVFMNVKANQRVSEMPEVNSIFCMPSAGDESNSIGSCFYGYKKYCEENNLKFEPKKIEDLYLGPEYDDAYVEEMIKRDKLKLRYKITKINDINKKVARLLADGNIVARCSGKSEWGARALGNRSILSDPSNHDTIRILNETIKDRDFWMPFTPSIIEESLGKYIMNKKKIPAPYMILTFDSTDFAKKHLPAAMHPYDFTLRPQSVYKKWNSDYHEVIKEFEKLKGIGGVLNTSFNLHGEPNVLTPEDAIHTVDNSALKYLAINNHLFEKK